jgi:hypothetical protein
MKFNIIRTVVEVVGEDGCSVRHEDYSWEVRYQDGCLAANPAIFDLQVRKFANAHETLMQAKSAADRYDFVEQNTGDLFSKAIERWECGPQPEPSKREKSEA